MKGTAKQALGFGIGAVGKDMVYALVSGFILYYYNDILGISGTFTGIMMMAARVFDAFNDPLMGVVVEKTKTRFGKFRPWIVTGTMTNALILYGMFAMPASLSGTRMLVYTSVAYVLWGVTYTLMDIPFWSMIPAITAPGKERENLSVIGRSCAAVGYAVPTILTMLLVVRLGSSEREGFSIFAAAVAVVFVVAELACVALVREKQTERQKSATVKEMFSALIHNDQAMVVVVGIIVFNASLYLTTQLGVYFFKYDIGNSDLFSLFGTVGGVGQILSMVSLPLLRRRWGSKQILAGALGITHCGLSGAVCTEHDRRKSSRAAGGHRLCDLHRLRPGHCAHHGVSGGYRGLWRIQDRSAQRKRGVQHADLRGKAGQRGERSHRRCGHRPDRTG